MAEVTAKVNRKKVIFTVATGIFFLITIFCLIMWISQISSYYYVDQGSILGYLLGWIYAFLAFLFFGIFAVVYCRMNDDLSVDKEIIIATSGIENFFNSWNNEYFLPQGCYVMAPRNLRYIQFVLDSNVKFSLEDHPYPADIIPRQYHH